MSNNLASIDMAYVPPQADESFSEVQSETASDQQVVPSVAEPQPVRQTAEEEVTPAKEVLAATEPTGPEEPLARERPSEERAIEGAQKTAMGEVLADDYAYQRPKRGEIRQGRIIAIRGDSIVVDLGLKREGVIPPEDLQRVGADVVNTLSVGDEIPVYVLRPEDDRDGILVSLHRARQEQDWIDAQRLYETGEVWEGKVKGYNQGGLIVHYGKIRGFVPASHLTGVSRRMDAAALQARLAEMVGQTVPLKVMEVDRENRRLIFSERTARREWRSRQREKLLDELREGDRVHGVVSNICDFGVFVDVGGTDGLVHISELSWRRTGHPSELLKVGDEVEAYVLRVDKERKRIGLSLRLTEPDPWQQVENKYQVGQLVTGLITKIAAFGAFAALDNGIEGLVHISELADIPPKHPEETVSVGMVLPLRIVKIDSKRRRIGLSLKRISEEERAQWEEERKVKEETEAQAEPLGEIETELEAQTQPSGEATSVPEAQVEASEVTVPEPEAKAEAREGDISGPEAQAEPSEETEPVTQAPAAE